MGRPWKGRLVREGKAHAALVFDGDVAVAWAWCLDLIAKAGGGVVEGYPHDLQGEKIRSQFHSATRSLFEEVGFSYERPKGKKSCVMRTAVSPVEAS
jgi:hypothetical protein